MTYTDLGAFLFGVAVAIYYFGIVLRVRRLK